MLHQLNEVSFAYSIYNNRWMICDRGSRVMECSICSVSTKSPTAAIQVCTTDDHVFVLFANGEISVMERKGPHQVVRSMCIKNCCSIACDSSRAFAVCSDGLVFELSLNEAPRQVINLKHELSCCALNKNVLCVGCDEIPHGSLIIVLNLDDLTIKEIVDGHLGGITKVKFYDNLLFSSAVDGLVCKYDEQYEIEQVFNVDASVMDFDVYKKKLLVLTDIHTISLLDMESETFSSASLARPDEEFGVFCVAGKHGSLVFFTNPSGALKCYKVAKGGKMVSLLNLPGHSAFVQDGLLQDRTLFTIDEENCLVSRDFIGLLKN